EHTGPIPHRFPTTQSSPCTSDLVLVPLSLSLSLDTLTRSLFAQLSMSSVGGSIGPLSLALFSSSLQTLPAARGEGEGEEGEKERERERDFMPINNNGPSRGSSSRHNHMH